MTGAWKRKWAADRRLEVVAVGLPLYGGTQLAISTTLMPLEPLLTAVGQPRLHCALSKGPRWVMRVCANIDRTYPEFANSCRCRLLVLAVELGARWMPVELRGCRPHPCSRPLRCCARAAPPPLRAAWAARWSAHVGFASLRGAAGLRRPWRSCHILPCQGAADVDGDAPPLSTTFADHAWDPPPPAPSSCRCASLRVP